MLPMVSAQKLPRPLPLLGMASLWAPEIVVMGDVVFAANAALQYRPGRA
jgi:hypothetical protein